MNWTVVAHQMQNMDRIARALRPFFDSGENKIQGIVRMGFAVENGRGQDLAWSVNGKGLVSVLGRIDVQQVNHYGEAQHQKEQAVLAHQRSVNQ